MRNAFLPLARHVPVNLVLLLGMMVVSGVGCRKSTPVDEVSVGESGVALTERAESEVDLVWPQWRGPNLDGTIDGAAPPANWNPGSDVAWQADVPGRGHSSPIVIGEQVVLASADEGKQQQMLLSYDRSTGEENWRRVIHEGGFPANREVHQKATNANTTPACDGQRILIAFLNQGRIFVTAVDLQGEVIWQTDIGAFASKFGYAPSPLFYQSFVIVAADNFGGGYIVALDSATGEIAWRRARGDASTYSSPMIANLGGMDQLLISGGDRVASYDPATGEPRWETPAIAEATCGTIVTAGDRLFASGGYPDKETACFSATGELLWSDRNKLYEPSMITDGDSLFGVTDNGVAMCWSIEDGSVKWRERLGGNFSASPVLVNDQIYVSDLSGNHYVFAADGDEFRQLAKNQLGSDCYASPAVAEGSLFLRIGFGEGSSRQERLVKISPSD
nr:PQQ-binding-like beta-propeller repeat protein [Rhodopirellula sp. JC737]